MAASDTKTYAQLLGKRDDPISHCYRGLVGFREIVAENQRKFSGRMGEADLYDLSWSVSAVLALLLALLTDSG